VIPIPLPHPFPGFAVGTRGGATGTKPACAGLRKIDARKNI